MPINVTLVGGKDRQLEELVRACGMRATSISVSDLAALAHPSSSPPDVVVLDLREQKHLPPSLALLKRQHPATGVVIVVAALDAELMLEAMRAGANECVIDLTQGDLEAAITRLVAQRVAPDAGDVFVFLGAKGGVGATTAAVNVATALGKMGSATLLVDLHLACGDAAVFLGAEPRFSIIDALDNTHRLDVTYFRGLVVRTKWGLDLLASSDRALVAPPDGLRVRSLIDFASRHYRYTVLDVPRSDSAMLDALESATTIVLITNQELATVRSASRMAAMLRQRYGKEKVVVALSRSDRLADIGHEDIERAVGGPVKHIFPSDYRLALQALNRGRPLVLEAQDKLAAAYQALARDLAGLTTEAAPAEKPTRMFGRLTGRRS